MAAGYCRRHQDGEGGEDAGEPGYLQLQSLSRGDGGHQSPQQEPPPLRQPRQISIG